MNKLLNSLPDNEKRKLKRKKMPEWTSPMLAVLTHNHFSDIGWIYERKLDGERCLIFRNGKTIKIMSRNKKKLNNTYPEIVDVFENQKPDNFIVDGEMVTFEGHKTSFSKLQNRMHLSSEKEARKSKVKVYYYAFDLIYFDGFDITGLELQKRKSILKDALSFNDPLRYLIHRNEKGEKYLDEACKKNWEGLIAKKADSQYKHSRAKNWLKFKCSNQQEFVIVGYTDPRGERIGFGALLISYYDNGDLRYAGKVGTGYDDKMLKMLSKKLSDIERSSSPIDKGKAKGKNIHWVTPKLVGEVGFTEWTNEGKLRHSRFLGLRRDKKAKDVVREDKG